MRVHSCILKNHHIKSRDCVVVVVVVVVVIVVVCCWLFVAVVLAVDVGLLMLHCLL